tara:strand:- start:124846 stop:125928 length:1083 start_codon:yes stop_codon:yes gene_type:complete
VYHGITHRFLKFQAQVTDIASWMRDVQITLTSNACDEQLERCEQAFLHAQERQNDAEDARAQDLPQVYANLVEALILNGNLDRALQIIGVGLSRFPGVSELLYQQADLALRLGHSDCAQHVFTKCQASLANDLGDVSPRDLAVAIGVTKAALKARRLRDALIAHRAVRALAPNSGVERALSLEILALSGQHHGMLENLAMTLDSDLVEAPEVQLFIGDHAWSQGDAEAALEMWKSAADPRTDVGQDALCRVALVEVCTGQRDAENALASLRDWSLEAACCRVVLAMLAQRAPEQLSRAIAPSFMLPSLMGWFEVVSETGRTDLLQRLALHASRLQNLIPGIEGLIVGDVEEKSDVEELAS